jgi:hypothetical protein
VIGELEDSKYPAQVPVIDGVELLLSFVHVTLLLTTGAALLMWGAFSEFINALTSSTVKSRTVAKLLLLNGPNPALITVSELVPSFSILSLTDLADPDPTAVRTITEETPIATPIMVRIDRSRFESMPPKANLKS